jgi:hypothetical protein
MPPRTQMPLRGNKLKRTTSPRVILGSSKNSGSWLVKTYHYIRIGCDRISQRAAQGSLYRGAGRQRRSERLKVAPYAHGRWPCFFVTCDCVIPIAWLRFRRGRPRAFLDRQVQDRLSERTIAAGGPLRAEGFPKRRC